ncbi:MAG TPA: ABC transporter ATP-binding protein [Candidatus Saccharimonadales bacterium]|nr:ABC transporter ATP-binding protein [Candidatus Saccharimonadales bacterium]
MTKVYRAGGTELHVLRGVDVVVRAGEWVSLVGPSGSGKSTLLRILGTLEEPTSGRVWLEGQVTSGQSEAPLARLRRQRVGFVFQFHNLLGEFTALENVMLPALLAGATFREARARAGALLEAVAVQDRAGHRPGELSGGEQQRVAVARALINQPGVVLADEPTGNLDPARAGELEELLAGLTLGRGAALLVATHSPVAARKAKRILQLDGGLVREAESLYRESGDPGVR